MPIKANYQDVYHQRGCQYFLQERWGELKGRTVAFIGDGNNVATSFVQAATMLGINVNVASPKGFELPNRIDSDVTKIAKYNAVLNRFTNPKEAVQNADAVYTDAWTSMGDEAEKDLRRRLFMPYQVNDQLMSLAKKDAYFMHCLPAHRGEEVTNSVIDGPTSIVFEQAENRLHTEKALLVMLFED